MDMSTVASTGYQSAYMHVANAQQDASTPEGKDPKIWAAAQDFESQFISTMFQSVFKGLKTDGPFDGGQGEEMFRSLLVDQYAQGMTKSGGVGLAKTVYSEILKLQEQHQ